MYDLVLARASQGEPIKRMLIEVGERVLYLANPARIAAVEAGESDPVGYPPEDVFEFDEAVYAALVEQWARQRVTSPATWRQLKRYRINP